MSFQRKLLAVFSLTVFLSVAAVTAIVSSVTRRAFDRWDSERAAGLIAQFRSEFDRRGQEVGRDVSAIAASEAATRMVLALNSSPDYGTFLNVARNVATDQRLDFLEFMGSDGTILSSAQWPAKFGYKDAAFVANPPPAAFLREEELPDGVALGLSAMREVRVADTPLYVVGGRRLDKDFLASLELPAGSRALFYQNLGNGFSPQLLLVPSGKVQRPELLAPLIVQVQQHNQEIGDVIHWTSDSSDDETVQAIPLDGLDNRLLGILLVGNSRRTYVGLQRHIRSAALLAAAAGILLATLFSGWAAARVTKPVRQLAEAARDISQGNWNTQVPVTSGELGQLAEAFNRMTGDLVEHRERLLQSERVAAWRELARRLAHELKNPLFPLQLTVENLVRAREHSPDQFEEVFRESTSTLLAEIANLKTIIGRFSEFSKMPQPHFQRVALNDLVRNTARLFQAQLGSPEPAIIELRLELGDSVAGIAADPELLHRALSNLALNAVDTMPDGGVLTLRTRQDSERAVIEISDTGPGLTPEECERIFTPYYTSKTHGTGLGLAIVQSVVSDHGGKISVRSQPGRGTTFTVELPCNLDKLPAASREELLSKTTP